MQIAIQCAGTVGPHRPLVCAQLANFGIALECITLFDDSRVREERRMCRIPFLHLIVPFLLLPASTMAQSAGSGTKLRFEVSFSVQQSDKPLDGRVYVMLSTDNKKEPRFEIDDDPYTQQFFGVDVDGLTA